MAVLERLQSLDDVAYLRFASVYKGFEEAGDFQREAGSADQDDGAQAQVIEETPGVVLAVYAHPDDADVGCGGTLARWAKGGSAVHLIVCTDGGKGTTRSRHEAQDARRRAGW